MERRFNETFDRAFGGAEKVKPPDPLPLPKTRMELLAMMLEGKLWQTLGVLPEQVQCLCLQNRVFQNAIGLADAAFDSMALSLKIIRVSRARARACVAEAHISDTNQARHRHLMKRDEWLDIEREAIVNLRSLSNAAIEMTWMATQLLPKAVRARYLALNITWLEQDVLELLDAADDFAFVEEALKGQEPC